MAEREVVIRINSRMIERSVYWLVILVLMVLLVLSFFNSDCAAPDTNGRAAANTELAAGDDQPEPEPSDVEPVVEEEPETCDDGIRNQDETDVDCGGVCDGCELGDSCDRDADCAEGECIDDECAEPEPELSGRISFSVGEVTTHAADSGAIKVESFSVVIENGKDENFFGSVEAYVTSTGGVLLNQFTDEEQPYIPEVELEKILPGEERTLVIDEAGSYIFEQTGYHLGDDFKLKVKLYDSDGDMIDEFVKSVRV